MNASRPGARRWRWLRGVSVLMVVLVVGLAPIAVRADAPPAAATPEAAVQLTVTSLGSGFAGDCASTRSPGDIGKACFKFVAQQDNIRAYLIGQTFSEFSAWVFVEQTATGWSPLSTVPYNDTAKTVPWPAA